MPFDGQREKRRYEEFRDQHGRIYGANIEIKTGDPCETLHPTGWDAPISPDWAKGLLMPPCDDYEIVKMVHPRLRARKGYQVQIDYVRWLQKWDEALERYQKKLHDFAKGMTKGSGLMLQLIADPPAELLKLIGRGPLGIPRVFIEAAAAGNPWALGLSDKVPTKAEAILAELKPIVTGKRKAMVIGYDPLADDEEESPVTDATLDAVLDPFSDLEEEVDPEATGRQSGRPPKPIATTWQQFAKEQMQQGKTMKEASVLWKERKKTAA